MGMDAYVRRQIVETSLITNLKDLNKQKIELLNSLIKTEKMIERHEAYLKKLEEEED